MYVDSHGEARIDVSQRWDYNVFDRSRPTYTTGTGVEVVVPFDGDPKLFMMRPSTCALTPPVADVGTGGVRLTFELLQRPEPAALKAQIERGVDQIAQHLAWTHELTDPFDEELPALVAKLVQARKQRLLDARGLVAELGIPVRRREDPGTYALPARRHIVPITRPPRVDTAFSAEPAFVTEDFEAALRIIRGARNTFERSPSMTASLDEENIRNLILVALNGHFEGTAGGELFNGNGKTDILIREADRNVFIGECKFWKGVKAFGEAIDQLLGYIVWRDAKAVLLLFIREKGVTEIVGEGRDGACQPPALQEGPRRQSRAPRLGFPRHGRPQPGDQIGATALRPAGTLDPKLSPSR